jgi:hypothetical protein
VHSLRSLHQTRDNKTLFNFSSLSDDAVINRLVDDLRLLFIIVMKPKKCGRGSEETTQCSHSLKCAKELPVTTCSSAESAPLL